MKPLSVFKRQRVVQLYAFFIEVVRLSGVILVEQKIALSVQEDVKTKRPFSIKATVNLCVFHTFLSLSFHFRFPLGAR